MGQLATTVGMLESQGSGKFSSQIVVNPRENASAITLRSGKELEVPKTVMEIEEEKVKEETETPKEIVISSTPVKTHHCRSHREHIRLQRRII